MVDRGLLIAMLEDGTQFDVLQGHLYGYKGAIFENLAADILAKMGRKLYCFHKDSGLEIDFVRRYVGQSTLLEVKASTGNAKSAKTVLNHSEKYHVGGAIKLGDYNVGRAGQILSTSSVNLSRNSFYVWDEQDIRSLAIEIATLTKRQQRGHNLRMT